MKPTFALLLFLLFFLTTFGQKYDYRWLSGAGYSGNTNVEALFSEDSCLLWMEDHNIDMSEAQVTISDSNANLLFASNWEVIVNAAGNPMSGNTSIDSGWVWEHIGGLFIDAAIGLPTDKINIWNLFTCYMESNPNSSIYLFPWQLRQHRIDMSGDTALGAVVFHDSILIQDTLAGTISACKHGNGRDWWLLLHQYNTSCLYELLVEPDTIINMGIQCLGGVYQTADAGQAEFSPDGSKFALNGNLSGINVYDFDRCTGVLSNPVHLPVYASEADSFTNYQYGLSFSPNSRFLYVAQIYYILQLDLTATDIFGSMDTVGIYQPPPEMPSFAGNFYVMQLAPNGKIYVCSTSSLKWWHVINAPDLPGTACNFVNYGQRLPQENSPGFPNYPNYRLGREIGSECDTIYNSDTTHVGLLATRSEKQQLKIFPNRAKDNMVIEYGKCDWSYGPMELAITDELGRTVYYQQLPMYSGYQQIDVSKFAAGAYTVLIKRNNNIIATGRLVKQ